MAKIIQPFSGLCLPNSLYNVQDDSGNPITIPCPALLRIWNGSISAAYDTMVNISGSWNGRCGGVDHNISPYFIASSDGDCYHTPFYIHTKARFVDVWKMYADGLWTSSISFGVTLLAGAAVSGCTIQASIASSGTNRCPSYTTVSKGSITTQVGCGSYTASATVTVHDDGTIT